MLTADRTAALTRFAKSPLGLGAALYPVPMLFMLAVSALGAVYLQRTVMGRHVFAVGSNDITAAASEQFAGLIDDVQCFNTTMTTAQILAIYQAGLPPAPTAPSSPPPSPPRTIG